MVGNIVGMLLRCEVLVVLLKVLNIIVDHLIIQIKCQQM